MLSNAFAGLKKIVSLYYCPAQRAQAQSSIYLYLYFTLLYLCSTLFTQKYTYYSRIFSLTHHFLSLLLASILSTKIKYLHWTSFIKYEIMYTSLITHSTHVMMFFFYF